mmetsp:Transcript_117354/g.328496  ORF Transcript_117354/g.328496 Transcript_117354/m.328496 type:complete len:465 (+) Transcript_117354:237-1631(+)
MPAKAGASGTRCGSDGVHRGVLGGVLRREAVVALEQLPRGVGDDHDVRHEPGGVAGHAGPRRGRGLEDVDLQGASPALAIHQAPGQQLAVVAQRVEPALVHGDLVQEEAVRQPLAPQLPVVRVRGPAEGADEGSDRHALRVAVPAEAAADLLVQPDRMIVAVVELPAVQHSVAAADHDPILHAMQQQGRRRAQHGHHDIVLDVPERRGHVLDELQLDLPRGRLVDLPELQQAAAAEQQDAVGVGRREEGHLGLLPVRAAAVDLDLLDALEVEPGGVHGHHLHGEPLAASPVRQEHDDAAVLLHDAPRQHLCGEEAHVVDGGLGLEPGAEAAHDPQGGLLHVGAVRPRPPPHGDAVPVVASGEDLAVHLVLAHADHRRDAPGGRLGGVHREGAAGLVAVHAADVVQAPVLRARVGAALSAQERRGTQPRGDDLPPVMEEHRLCRVPLPELEDVVGDGIRHVDVAL